MVTTTVDFKDFQTTLARFGQVTRKSLEESVEHAARSAVNMMVKYTPPGGRNVQGTAAKKALEARIEADFGGIFVPVKLKGKRPEEHPDLKPLLHRQQFKRKGVAMRRVPARPPYWVDQRKHAALLKEKKARVGRAASGWKKAIAMLGVKGVPKWITRHDGIPGSASKQGTGSNFEITVSNGVTYLPERQREALVYFGIQAATNGMNQAIQRILERRARAAAIRAQSA